MELYSILGKASEDMVIGISADDYVNGLFLLSLHLPLLQTWNIYPKTQRKLLKRIAIWQAPTQQHYNYYLFNEGIGGYTIFIIFPPYCVKYRVSRSHDYTQTY